MCITRGGGEEEVCMPGRVGGKNQRGGGMNVMFPTSWRGRRGREGETDRNRDSSP